MADKREDLRAADADRQVVVERLQVALNEGRLTLAEYDERVAQAYSARTYGELDALLTDLPNARDASQSQVAPAQSPPVAPAAPTQPGQLPPAVRTWLVGIWGTAIGTSAICTLIWLLTGEHGHFWPIWVILFTIGGSLLRTIQLVASGDPDRHAQADLERQAQRRAQRDARRRYRY